MAVPKPLGVEVPEGFDVVVPLHPTIKAAGSNAMRIKQTIIFFTFASPDLLNFKTSHRIDELVRARNMPLKISIQSGFISANLVKRSFWEPVLLKPGIFLLMAIKVISFDSRFDSRQ